LDKHLDEINKDNPFLNPKVDKRFDFYNLGNNFRNSDINAFIGLQDLKKADKHKDKRVLLYSEFCDTIGNDKFLTFQKNLDFGDVPFALPIILKEQNNDLIDSIKDYLDKAKIEYRPIISGHLGYQTAFKKYFSNLKAYNNSLYIHEYGLYVGLHSGLTIEQVQDLAIKLNILASFYE
jgi:CDP-6-deoxy-D-xylo-4-hexulose-3-dehydrase